jgi:hypothetical protein
MDILFCWKLNLEFHYIWSKSILLFLFFYFLFFSFSISSSFSILLLAHVSYNVTLCQGIVQFDSRVMLFVSFEPVYYVKLNESAWAFLVRKSSDSKTWLLNKYWTFLQGGYLVCVLGSDWYLKQEKLQ